MPRRNLSKIIISLSGAVVIATVPTAVFAEHTFSDVPEDHDYHAVINDLTNTGIVSGYPDGTFGIGEPITRAEASSMVANLLELNEDAPDTSFKDVKNNVWYTDAINRLYAAGYINGMDEDTFAPQKTMTRAEVATLIVSAYEMTTNEDVDLPFEDVKEDAWYTDAIKTLYANGHISGQDATTFGPNDAIKRGDFLWLIANVDYSYSVVWPAVY